MAERYNFKYLPLVGKLPGKSMVEQTETAINELASVVYDNVGYVGNLAEEVQTANTNASSALDKATEALETSGRVYIKQIAAVDVNDYYDSELYYINNDGSTNIPVRDRGFLEVKTNDDKTACEQVFIADSTGTPYYRHGVITEQTLGEETTYVVTWGSWYQGATTEYVNAYTDEQIRQHGNVPVGFEYFSMNPNVPQGSLPLLGGEYSRATYPDLWAWVQEQTGYLKTESEWQALSTANNGNVPYYSSGDGSTTFRVPSLQCWVRGANGSVSTVGSYLAAGLPNITGKFYGRPHMNGGNYGGAITGSLGGGAFAWTAHTGNASVPGVQESSTNSKEDTVTIDASRSSSVYGNSSTVQPESIVGLWLVKAYGTIVDTGTIDEQQYIDDRIAALPNTFLPRTGGTMSGDIEFYDNLYLGSPLESDSNQKTKYAGLYSNKNNPHKYCGISFINQQTGNIRPQTNISAGDGTNRNFLTVYGDAAGGVTYKGIDISIAAMGTNYIRYNNGIQICWGGYSGTATMPITITYPAAFIANGDYPSIGIQSGNFEATSLGYDNFKIGMATGHTKPSTVYFKYIAIGRWK